MPYDVIPILGHISLSESQYTHVHTCTHMYTHTHMYNTVTVITPSTGIADLDKVKTFLNNLVDWQSLGLKLGFLYTIEIDHRGMAEQCKTKMLAAWLQQQDNV